MARNLTQTYGVVGGILERDGKILLMKEAADPDKGKWQTPGGMWEIGEDYIAAAKREVLEESGFEFNPTHLLGIYSIVREDLRVSSDIVPHAIKFIFTGDILNEEPKELEEDAEETNWFTRGEILDMNKETLRDGDVKKMVEDYFAGQRYPLELINQYIRQ